MQKKSNLPLSPRQCFCLSCVAHWSSDKIYNGSQKRFCPKLAWVCGNSWSLPRSCSSHRTQPGSWSLSCTKHRFGEASDRLFPGVFWGQKTNVSGERRCALVHGSNPNSKFGYKYTPRDLEGWCRSWCAQLQASVPGLSFSLRKKPQTTWFKRLQNRCYRKLTSISINCFYYIFTHLKCVFFPASGNQFVARSKLLPRLNATSLLQILFPRKDICRCFPLGAECYQWIENL